MGEERHNISGTAAVPAAHAAVLDVQGFVVEHKTLLEKPELFKTQEAMQLQFWLERAFLHLQGPKSGNLHPRGASWSRGTEFPVSRSSLYRSVTFNRSTPSKSVRVRSNQLNG
jgi:hypothetical protein